MIAAALAASEQATNIERQAKPSGCQPNQGRREGAGNVNEREHDQLHPTREERHVLGGEAAQHKHERQALGYRHKARLAIEPGDQRGAEHHQAGQQRADEQVDPE